MTNVIEKVRNDDKSTYSTTLAPTMEQQAIFETKKKESIPKKRHLDEVDGNDFATSALEDDLQQPPLKSASTSPFLSLRTLFNRQGLGFGSKKISPTELNNNLLGFSEPVFDKPPPKHIGFLDWQRLEHATKSLQKNLYYVLSLAPNYNELKHLMNSDELDNNMRSELQQGGDLITLASKLKFKYQMKGLGIFDDFLNGEIEFTKEELEILDDLDKKLVATSNLQIGIADKSQQQQREQQQEQPQEQPQEQQQQELKQQQEQKDESLLSPLVSPQASQSPSDVSPTGIKNDLPTLPVIRDSALYEKVFVHKSTVNNRTYLGSDALIHKHNERLEFYGDSILNNLITIIIYNKFPNNTEGELSKIRAAMINNRVLKEIAVDYGFDKKLRTRIDQDVLNLGEQKIYADVFEAYIGALGLERQFDLKEVKDWLEILYAKRITDLQREYIKDPLDRDAKAELYSMIGTGDLHPTYKVHSAGDGIHTDYVVDCFMNREFLGRGIAVNQKEASLRAAMNALKNTAVLEKYVIERKKIEKPVRLLRKERLELKRLEKQRKLEAELEDEDGEESELFVPDSPIHTSMFPIKVDYDDELEHDVKNSLYALIGKETGTKPEYIVAATENNKHTVQLRIRNLNVATACDTSKRKAMSRCANAIWKDKAALKELCKRFEPPKR